MVNRTIDENVIDGAYAVVNLTGMPLDTRRWDDEVKKQLIQSRVEPAKFLDELLGEAQNPPGSQSHQQWEEEWGNDFLGPWTSQIWAPRKYAVS